MWCRPEITHQIDPTKLSAGEAEILHEFLLQEERKKNPRKIFLRYINYTFVKDNIKHTIIFNHQLVRRTRLSLKNPLKKYANKYTYTVYDPSPHLALGAGSFGLVHQVSGKLRHAENSNSIVYSVPKPGKEQVIKEELITKRHGRKSKDLKLENALTRTVGYLNAKKITFKKSFRIFGKEKKIAGYTVMEKLGTHDLSEYLQKNQDLSFEERLRISINLLKALKIIHDAGIIHRDIKPQNIRIDATTLDVYILDFGLSKRKDKLDTTCLGTPSYVAPEIVFYNAYNANIDGIKQSDIWNEATDIYSMGLIFKRLWSEKFYQKIRQEEGDDGNITLKRKLKEHKDDINYNIQFPQELKDQLPECYRYKFNKISKILFGITRSRPENRMSNVNALNELIDLLPIEESLQELATINQKRYEPFEVPPPWLYRIGQILEVIENHLDSYNNTKKTYIAEAIKLVRDEAIKLVSNDGIILMPNDHATRQRIKENNILDLFKVVMVCCFQNQNGNEEFFRSIKTKTGFDLEKELRVIDYQDHLECPTTALRTRLFSEYYGRKSQVLPNYHDMVNMIYEDQIAYYKNPNNRIDILQTAQNLINEAHPSGANVSLTVELLAKKEIISEYNIHKPHETIILSNN